MMGDAYGGAIAVKMASDLLMKNRPVRYINQKNRGLKKTEGKSGCLQ